MRSSLPINEIAKAAGVSPATVSRVINHREQVKEATVVKVAKAMGDLGITLPKTAEKQSPGLDNEKRKVILVNRVTDSNPFYAEVFRGIRTAAKAHGYELLVSGWSMRPSEMNNVNHMLDQIGVSGLITLNQIGTEELNFLGEKVPTIQCSEYNPDSDVPYVGVDDAAALKTAVEYLINTGRNKIAFVNGPIKYQYAKERLRGFQEAMEEASLSVPRNWLLSIPDIDYDMAYTAVSQVLSQNIRPNAFVTASDVLALACINAARRYKLRVPNDIMVVGFDNIDLCKMSRPTITTVAQPQFQLGFTACENLVEMIANPGIRCHSVLLATELILRNSTRL